MNQAEAVGLFLPVIRQSGKTYTKKVIVEAIKAAAGQAIDTITSDGKETTNTAKEGDFIVRNGSSTKERYILTQAQIAKRYRLIGPASEHGWDRYQAVGQCVAVPYVSANHGLKPELTFTAIWGEDMVLKEGDMLCCPVGAAEEVYRIARKEFEETYALA